MTTALAITTSDLALLHEDEAQLEKVAVVDGARRLTYRALQQRIEALAAHLAGIGVERGDRVVVHVGKSLEEVVAMFACWRVGAVTVNVNTQWTLDQLRYVIADSEARVALVDARRAKELVPAKPAPLARVIVKGACPEAEGFEPWPSDERTERAPARRLLDVDLAAILYTSGSTGAPKGVMLTHTNLLLGARSVSRYLGIRPDDRLLSLLPFSFDYGLNQLLTSCLLGATVVLSSVTMPSVIVKTLLDERVTGFAAVPPAWIQVVRYLEELKTPLPDLRYVTNSGGKIPQPILEAMPRVFPGARIFLMYGLTEAFRSTYLDPSKFDRKKGSIGQAVPDVETFVVVHGKGRAAPGEEGELVHRGSFISRGYWRRPDATAEKIRPCAELRDILGDEPVVWSGDLVRIDEEGDMWFVGRADGMIKSMGFRLSPTEVEEIIHASGLVSEVVAWGVEDELAGQVVNVCVAAPGRAIDVDALLSHCREKMPHYMVPRRIEAWDGEMPRTASGKIDGPAVIRACKARTTPA